MATDITENLNTSESTGGESEGADSVQKLISTCMYGTLFPAGDIIDISIEVSGPNVAILWDIAGPGEREAEKVVAHVVKNR